MAISCERSSAEEHLGAFGVDVLTSQAQHLTVNDTNLGRKADAHHERARTTVAISSLRIAQLLNSLEVGGAERMALNLAISESHAGHAPLLYSIEREGVLASEARAEGIPVTCFDKPAGKSVRTVLQIARALIRDRIDILHTHNPSAHYYGAPAAYLARIPVVNTRHSPISSRGQKHKERNFKLLLPITDQVVFVSSDALVKVERQWQGWQASTSVIRNGIPVARFSGHPNRPRLGGKFTFGAVGRLVPVKRYDLLIDAFQIVQKSAPDSHLRIVGDGPLAETLHRRVVEAGLKEAVTIEARRLDIERVFHEFDAFVVSSASEGLPMVVLEAMASGLPIVSTRVGGIAEIVEEHCFGWFCQPDDRQSLADAMLKARKFSGLSNAGQMAELAARNYDISCVVERYLEVFTRLKPTRPKN